MLVANSFDLWQKDTFFSAAEEVQQSADIMESSYRTWLRARTEGCQQEDLDELSRELQMALSTAKWQLEEFEKAICMSYRGHRDDITVTRHSQFASVLEDQISRVEATLKESFQGEGKKELHWVNLDEEQCDDLALFLFGSTGTSESNVNEAIGTILLNKKISGKENSNLGSGVSSTIQSSGEGRSPQKANEDASSISFYADGNASNRRTWSPSHRGALEIVIDKDDIQNNADIEATPKEKCTKPFFWNSRGEDHVVVKGGVLSPPQLNMINWINQRLRGCHRNQRQQQMVQLLPVNSLRLLLALLLIIFLVGMCSFSNNLVDDTRRESAGCYKGGYYRFWCFRLELPRSKSTIRVCFDDGGYAEMIEMVLFVSFNFCYYSSLKDLCHLKRRYLVNPSMQIA